MWALLDTFIVITSLWDIVMETWWHVMSRTYRRVHEHDGDETRMRQGWNSCCQGVHMGTLCVCIDNVICI